MTRLYISDVLNGKICRYPLDALARYSRAVALVTRTSCVEGAVRPCPGHCRDQDAVWRPTPAAHHFLRPVSSLI
jgi:hypothetical protein